MPKNEPKSDPVAAPEEEPQEAPANFSDLPEFQTAVRVETFSEGDKWGWRSVAANGSQVRASGADFDSQKEAIRDAKGSDHNDGLDIPDATPVSAETYTP